MTENNIKAIAASGVADAMRRAPVIWALVFEALLIAVLLWVQVSNAKAEREAHALYVQTLHAKLVECHRGGH